MALLALWLLATLGVRPLLLPDEGRYAGVAREMLWRGDWLTPRVDGLPFFHKPPLMYWLDMAAMSMGGVNEFTARVAPFVGAWVMAAALFFAVRRWHGQRTALSALLVLATMPFFFVGAQYANHDMLVAGFISAAVLAFVRALDAPRPELRWVVAGWALAALAVLAKGLIGIVLPALVVGPWLLWQGRWRDVLRLLHPAGVGVFALVALPWFVLMQARYPGFFDYFVVEQHFRRFAIAKFNNQQPWWFFLLAVPALTLPWSVWLPLALRPAWQRVRRDADSRRLVLYAWWWVAIVGFFSLPSSKLVGYVLPALVPWCLLLASVAQRRPRAMAACALAGAAVCVGFVVYVAVKAPHSAKGLATELGQRVQPGDRVVFIDNAYFDIPFYARLQQPVIIVSDWDSPLIAQRDDWRKELADAGRFDPERAKHVLWPTSRVAEFACRRQPMWFVMERGPHAAVDAIPGLVPVANDDKLMIKRASARAC